MTHANAAYGSQQWVPIAPQPWDQIGDAPFESRPRWEPELEFDPGIYVAPHVPDPSPTVADPTAEMGVWAHASHAAGEMVLPGLLAGGVSGLLATSARPDHKLLAFGSRAVNVASNVVVTGALTGALVGMTSPDREASLEQRYAVAGLAAGAATGAAMPGGHSRGMGAAAGAATAAVLGWFIGNGLERREDAVAGATAITPT